MYSWCSSPDRRGTRYFLLTPYPIIDPTAFTRVFNLDSLIKFTIAWFLLKAAHLRTCFLPPSLHLLQLLDWVFLHHHLNLSPHGFVSHLLTLPANVSLHCPHPNFKFAHPPCGCCPSGQTPHELRNVPLSSLHAWDTTYLILTALTEFINTVHSPWPSPYPI